MLDIQKLTRKLPAAQATEIHEWWLSLEPRERLELRRDAGRPRAALSRDSSNPGNT
jgi:hypothetical protein